jgi:hypothetical protein
MVGGYVPLCGSVRRTKACLAFLAKNSRTQELKNSRTQELKNSRTQELKKNQQSRAEVRIAAFLAFLSTRVLEFIWFSAANLE